MQATIPYTRHSDVNTHLEKTIPTHLEYTPYWTHFAENTKLKRDGLVSLEDLRKLPYVGDDLLRSLNPEDLTPSHYVKDDLVRSTSSGTTGEHKTVYWDSRLIEDMANYGGWTLSLRGFPDGGYWLGTVTDNPMLKMFLNRLAGYFGAEFHEVEVDGKTAKQVLAGRTEEERMRYFQPIVDRLLDVFQARDVRVYEDIAPLLAMTGRKLRELGIGNSLEGILFGGVRMNRDVLSMFQRDLYTNRKFGGWYGDYMSGMSMLINENPDSNNLTYFPFAPYVIAEVRKEDDISETVKEGERGIVVVHRIGPDIFLPNRITGDSAVRVRSSHVDWDGVGDVNRLPPEIIKKLERKLSSPVMVA